MIIPRLAETVVLNQDGFTIDGEEFPYLVSDEGVRVEYNATDYAVIWVPIYVQRVEVGGREDNDE